MEWKNIKTLDEMGAYRVEFIADPGCDVDFDGIGGEMGDFETEDGEALSNAWFDRLLAAFRNKATLTLFRHMTVDDFAAYVQGLEDGLETTGFHWSLCEDTWSPAPEQQSVDVMLTGSLPASRVDWLTTFRNFFARPEEQEVTFEGEIHLVSVKNIQTGEVHEPSRPAYPTFR